MTQSPSIPRGYLPTLDGWRAVAILGVMAAHATDRLFIDGGAWPNEFWYGVTRYGAKGVDVFFGISGFLICSRLIEEIDARGRIDLKGFYIRRFFRILPPYFVFLGAVSLLGAAGVFAVTGPEVASSLLFLRNYYPVAGPAGWYTGHLWSLAIEEHFYVIWPSLLALWGLRRARWGVAILSVALAAWRVLEFRMQFGAGLIPELGFYGRTDVRLDALLWGCWFALVGSLPWVKALMTRYLNGPVWMVFLAILLACMVRQPPLALMWQSILIPLVVVGTVVRPTSVVSQVLELAPVRWVGRLSYSLYLWQQVFLVGAEAGPLPLGVSQTLPLNIPIVFALSIVSYYGIERPMIKAGHRLAAPVTEGRR